VMQADSGADLDFLVGASGHEVPRESHLPRLLREPGRNGFYLRRLPVPGVCRG
jgi:hypothetical protein